MTGRTVSEESPTDASARRVAAGRATRPSTRVAALIDTGETSGPGRQLAALARALEARGVELLVIMLQRRGRPSPPYAAYLERAGVRCLVLPERGRVDLRLIGRIGDVLADWKPDVVQTHSYKTTALAYALRLRGARWPWIAFFHGATSEDLKVKAYHWLDRRLMARADRIVVMSRAHARGFASLGDRVSVVHNAVIPLPSEAEALDVARAGASTVRPRLGVVGRLSPEKGVDVFLECCALLRARGATFSAVIAGDGPERQALEAQRDRLGLADVVHFLGSVRAVRSLYPQLDLLVIPSRSEGLPNVLLEALGADVPVVATEVGAVPEVLEDQDAGIVVPSESPSALADAIVRALPMKANRRCADARAATAARFSLARRAEEHLRLYARVLGGREVAAT